MMKVSSFIVFNSQTERMARSAVRAVTRALRRTSIPRLGGAPHSSGPASRPSAVRCTGHCVPGPNETPSGRAVGRTGGRSAADQKSGRRSPPRNSHHRRQRTSGTKGPGEKRTVCVSKSMSSTAPRKMEAPEQNRRTGLTTCSGEIDEPLTSASIGWKSMAF
jgi:hypothetical protein